MLHVLSVAGAAFLASLVEAIEALTVVLATGAVRGWRDTLTGVLAALVTLLVLCAALGSTLTLVPVRVLQTALGALLLLFGLRWLRKAILRAAGVLALHDETQAYQKARGAASAVGRASGFDLIAFAAAYQIVMLEGIEIVFIVLAVAIGGAGLMAYAAGGAVAAVVLIAALGLVLHRPLARVPENSLKLVVGVALSGFGAFWIGEGLGVGWPGGDLALVGLLAGFAVTAAAGTALARAGRSAAA
jgi:uncharacterized membrane protein